MRLICFILAATTPTSIYAQVAGEISWSENGFEDTVKEVWPDLTYDIYQDDRGLIWKINRSQNTKKPFDDGRADGGDIFIDNASEFCSYVKLGGVWEFRLPSISELKRLENTTIFNPTKQEYWSNEVSTSSRSRSVKTYNFRDSRESARRPSYSAYSICVTNKHNSLSLDSLSDKFLEIKQSNFKESIDTSASSKPVAPILREGSISQKGEFETTAMYHKRLGAAEEAAKTWYENELRSYNSELERWEKQKNLNAETLNAQSIQFMHNENNEKLKAVGHAVNFLYGSPVIQNANYNADAEEFTIKVSSVSERYSETVVVPVNLAYAPKFKSLLLKSDFSPTILFKYSNSRLIFSGIKELQDTTNFVEQAEFKKASGSVQNLTNFIEKYPNSSFNSQATGEITELRLQEAKLLAIQKALDTKRIEDDRKRAEQREIARIEEEAAKKVRKAEEARTAYAMSRLGECSVGKTVYHRDTWSATTSSGNIIADGLFGAATKEQFIIVYEGVVKGFLGEKVEVVVNDYAVKQTLGGGFFQPRTDAKNDISTHADRYIGKTQFYDKSRCD